MTTALPRRVQTVGGRDDRGRKGFWIETRDSDDGWAAVAAYLRAPIPRVELVVITTGRLVLLYFRRDGRRIQVRCGRLTAHTTGTAEAMQIARAWVHRAGRPAAPDHRMWTEAAAKRLGVRLDFGPSILGSIAHALLANDGLAWMSTSRRPR